MKRLIIFVSILCITYLVFPGYAAAADTNEIEKPDTAADVNSGGENGKINDSNKAADVNAVEDSNRMLGELKKDLTSIDKESQKELREWTREGGEGKTAAASTVVENKIKLAEAVRDQIVNELNFLKGIAVEEGAVKTAKAIEILLADRKERLDKTIKQMKEDVERLKEKEEKRERSQTKAARIREGTVTSERSYDRTSPSLEERRKKREEILKEREEKRKLREEQLKKTQTKDVNSLDDSMDSNEIAIR